MNTLCLYTVLFFKRISISEIGNIKLFHTIWSPRVDVSVWRVRWAWVSLSSTGDRRRCKYVSIRLHGPYAETVTAIRARLIMLSKFSTLLNKVLRELRNIFQIRFSEPDCRLQLVSFTAVPDMRLSMYWSLRLWIMLDITSCSPTEDVSVYGELLPATTQCWRETERGGGGEAGTNYRALRSGKGPGDRLHCISIGISG
jgi:hypothetical protein